MKILIDDIKASPKELAYTEQVDELNARLGSGVQDYRVTSGLRVSVEYYRAGLDIFFSGALHGDVHGTCARCADDYVFDFEQPFTFVLTPRAAGLDDARNGAGLTPDEMALSTYEGDQVDLTPLVHEQMILALPTRPLCKEACRGLCPQCGANLNAGACNCPGPPPDPRWAVLQALARGK